VPSPSLPSGACDTSIVTDTIKTLTELNYPGIIAIKSTVSPGTTQHLIDQYRNPNICFVPEFLKERSALEDFVNRHNVLAVGCVSDAVWECVCRVHSILPACTTRMTPTEAEILKYYSNTFAALKVTFANVMYEVCEKFDSNYDTVLSAFLSRDVAASDYLKCSTDMRGYGGMCLPKDVNAMV
jgi:UDPglucose 6-dehydrogenase